MSTDTIREYRLRIGSKLTGVSVRGDEIYPDMWRIHSGGRVSDIVNLTRAKDAAISWALGGVRGLRPGDVVRWDIGETAAGACPVRSEVRAA